MPPTRQIIFTLVPWTCFVHCNASTRAERSAAAAAWVPSPFFSNPSWPSSHLAKLLPDLQLRLHREAELLPGIYIHRDREPHPLFLCCTDGGDWACGCSRGDGDGRTTWRLTSSTSMRPAARELPLPSHLLPLSGSNHASPPFSSPRQPLVHPSSDRPMHPARRRTRPSPAGLRPDGRRLPEPPHPAWQRRPDSPARPRPFPTSDVWCPDSPNAT
jgi:hypothetical protein